MSIIENVQSLRHPNSRDILSGFEGVVKPGEMIRMFVLVTWCSEWLNLRQVVLGSPGSGCSTLLKTLANQTKEYYAVSGEVHYDSLSPEELDKHFRGDVQYCPENDVHFPTLTVHQTLGFAAAARTPQGGTFDNVTTTLSTVFGLKHALDTPVGDAAIRGISGGEKKRVSIAEALASRACIGAWDKCEILSSLSFVNINPSFSSTRGLDASTALDFARALRIATDTFEQTTIVSIYQAAESLYRYFDKVCVIYAGRMAYFGPAGQARQYFMDMGSVLSFFSFENYIQILNI
jgi:ATP-binding cassette subfamily G (WHITE) protein 2 (SNQ2)